MTMALVMDTAKPDDIMKDTAKSDDTREDNNGELTEYEQRLQEEVKKDKLYDRVYIGQLSEEEMTDTEMDKSAYSYFD